jgi:TonB family protein
VIGPSGDVRAARVVRSIPVLDEAALEGVRQWRFAPVLVNGAPGAVFMTVPQNYTPT